MEQFKTFVLLIVITLITTTSARAQGQREDVVYLKNGTVYRGLIVEQVFNVSLKIETNDGKTVDVKIAEVSKIAKENKTADQPASGPQPQADTTEKIKWTINHRRNKRPFNYPGKGYYFQGQAVANIFGFGAHMIDGYKFGQFGMLGAGAGFEYVFGAFGDLGNMYTGWHFPVFLHYSGDILRKRVTPVYTIEIGYAFRYHPHEDYLHMSPADVESVRTPGGVTASFGFGFKVYSDKKVNAGLLFNVDFRQGRSKYHYSYFDGYQNVRVDYNTSGIMYLPGIKVFAGF